MQDRGERRGKLKLFNESSDCHLSLLGGWRQKGWATHGEQKFDSSWAESALAGCPAWGSLELPAQAQLAPGGSAFWQAPGGLFFLGNVRTQQPASQLQQLWSSHRQVHASIRKSWAGTQGAPAPSSQSVPPTPPKPKSLDENI